MNALIKSEAGEHLVTVGMALLKNEVKASYTSVFEAIQEKWADLRITPKFNRIPPIAKNPTLMH